MNNIVVEREAPTCESLRLTESLFEICRHFDLTPIPLKPKSKVPLVRWSDESWKPTSLELETWASKPGINWGVRCGENLAVIDCDSEDAYSRFTTRHRLPGSCPIVKTSRGYHIWLKPKRPIRSQRVDGIEIKCLGSYIVAPPSIHPSGTAYVFQVPPNGVIPEVDFEGLFSLPGDNAGSSGKNPTNLHVPSDFALRYGKSPYPQSLCAKATKVLTRADGEVKHLVSLRCWKWHCSKCAPLLKRHWLSKLGDIPFRFILRLPTVTKPAAFLRHVGKPDYAHVVANGESWLFLTDGAMRKVAVETQREGYDLIAGDMSGDPTPQEIGKYLEQALCREDTSLNTRRKVSHSRGLFKKPSGNDRGNESKQKDDCSEEKKDMNAPRREPLAWDTKVVMKSIDEVAKELEAQGWKIIWQSEVEALAVKGDAVRAENVDIVELIENLGVKLKKVGKEYMGLCPFHDDHDLSLAVNREKRVWHCHSTGCGKGGGVGKFIQEWQSWQR